jgi:GAF domain-containing protein
MRRDDDLQAVLASLKAEQDELRSEADGLRRFISCMRRLMDAEGSRQRESEVYVLLEQVLDNAISAVNARDGSILLPDRRTRELVFFMVRGDEAQSRLVGRRLPPGEGIAGWVAGNRRAVIVNNVGADERFYPGVDRELDYHTQSVLAAPLIGGDRLLGVVEVVNKRDRRLFSVGNQTLLALMCRFAGELLASTLGETELGDTAHASAAVPGSGPPDERGP